MPSQNSYALTITYVFPSGACCPSGYHLGNDIALSGIKLKGEYEFLTNNNIFISKSFFRIREEDIFTCRELVSQNHQYKNRYLYGPSWRADIIYSIEIGISNPFQISKFIGCSYEPAYRIFKEYNLAIAA